MQKQILIVAGYGLIDKNLRTPEEMEGLKNYYDQLIDYIQNNKENIKGVIFTGGNTNPQKNLSEAHSAFDLCNKKIKDMVKIAYKEEISRTSAGNICHGLLRAWHLIEKDDLIVIVCDKARKYKLGCIADILIGQNLSYQIESFEREDNNPNSTLDYQSTKGIASTVLNDEIWILRKLLISYYPKLKK
jgi:hypothetical protein